MSYLLLDGYKQVSVATFTSIAFGTKRLSIRDCGLASVAIREDVISMKVCPTYVCTTSLAFTTTLLE